MSGVVNGIRILALDQARNGAWSVYDYDNKLLIDYDVFKVGASSHSFEEFLYIMTQMIDELVNKYSIDAVFFEDTQYQNNVNTFKKLCWLQGSIICWLEGNGMLYEAVTPSQWQNYCNARGRSTKEKKAGTMTLAESRKRSKALTIEYVRDQFGIDTDNDNLADAICIGFYVVNNIKIRKGTQNGKEKGI